MTSALICTPAYGGQVTEAYFQSVLGVLSRATVDGVGVGVYTVHGESLVTRARNNCVTRFLQSEADLLFFIDADIDFEPEAFVRLAKSGYDVCAAAYPLKQAGVGSVVNALGPIRDDGFAPAAEAGTGFMCISRAAIERMIRRYPQLAYHTDQAGRDPVKAWALFDTTIRDGRYLSEDYTFCHRWRAIGGEVMVDQLGPPLGHIGAYRYGES